MATIFPREEKAEMLFDKILANPDGMQATENELFMMPLIPEMSL